MGSVGVIISTILLKYFGWTGFDPIASLFIAVLITASVIPLVLESGKILILDVSGHEQEIASALEEVRALLCRCRLILTPSPAAHSGRGPRELLAAALLAEGQRHAGRQSARTGAHRAAGRSQCRDHKAQWRVGSLVVAAGGVAREHLGAGAGHHAATTADARKPGGAARARDADAAHASSRRCRRGMSDTH
jgi:hypothetical protein